MSNAINDVTILATIMGILIVSTFIIGLINDAGSSIDYGVSLSNTSGISDEPAQASGAFWNAVKMVFIWDFSGELPDILNYIFLTLKIAVLFILARLLRGVG